MPILNWKGKRSRRPRLLPLSKIHLYPNGLGYPKSNADGTITISENL